jgi:hypothetical protein
MPRAQLISDFVINCEIHNSSLHARQHQTAVTPYKSDFSRNGLDVGRCWANISSGNYRRPVADFLRYLTALSSGIRQMREDAHHEWWLHKDL